MRWQKDDVNHANIIGFISFEVFDRSILYLAVYDSSVICLYCNAANEIGRFKLSVIDGELSKPVSTGIVRVYFHNTAAVHLVYFCSIPIVAHNRMIR